MQKDLSVIVPVYNVEKFLRQCLESIFIQGVENIEVICVNDGSTDNSLSILKEYKILYPDLIIIDRKNGGLPAARNSGFEIASGKYIYYLDSDDYLLPDALNRAISFVLERDLDVCFFNVLKDGKIPYFSISKETNEILTGKELYKLNYQVNNFFPPSAVWTNLYKREFLTTHNIKFKEGIVHEDEEYTPRVYFLANRSSYFNIYILVHRILREGSVTAATLISFQEKNLKDIIETCSNLYHYFNKMKCPENYFYLKIFHNYLAMAKIIVNKKPERKNNLFTKNDFNTMRLCAISWDWYVYYFLFRYSTPIFKWYTSEKASPFLKMFVTKLFKLIYS
jgi:heptose III glucuronosyltransferase